MICPFGRFPPSGAPLVSISTCFFDDNPARLDTIREVATNHLLASPLPSAEVTVRGDCLGAFQLEFDYLCRTLRRLGVPAADIEDVAHEVFLVLHRRWEDYDPSCALRPWLFGIAFRVAASHRRRSAREVPHGWLDIEDSGREPEEPVAAGQPRTIVPPALREVALARRAFLVSY